jgi:hypothetical protein
MNKRFQKTQKRVLVLCLIFTILLPTNIFALDVTNFIGLVPGIANVAEGPPGVPTAEPVQRTKESCTTIPFIHKCIGPSLDHIALILLRIVVNKLGDYTVNFINNGFKSQGGPGFAVDLEKSLLNASDAIAGDIINQATNGAVCSPFQDQVRLALKANQNLNNGRYSDKFVGSCSLSQVSNNIKGFMDGDFIGGGGWDAWYTMTQDPLGNPYSSMFTVQADIDSRIAKAVGLKKQQLDWSKGFLSTQKCLIYTVVINDKLERVDASPSGVEELPANAECTKFAPVKTPGSVIEAQLTKVFGSKVDQLNVASNFNQIIVALASQLEAMIFNSAEGLFANSASNGGNYNANSSGGAPGGIQGSCIGGPSPAVIGDTVTWSFAGAGGNDTSYEWSGEGLPSGATTSPSVSTSYQTGGTKTAQLTVTERTPTSFNASGTPITFTTKTLVFQCSPPVKVSQWPPLSGTCFPTQDGVNINTVARYPTGTFGNNLSILPTVTWRAVISGGSGQLPFSIMKWGDSGSKEEIIPYKGFPKVLAWSIYLPTATKQPDGSIVILGKRPYLDAFDEGLERMANLTLVDQDQNVDLLKIDCNPSVFIFK